MPSYLVLGRRKRDIGLMIDFGKTRAIVRANTAWIEGITLEKIDLGPNELRTGMVLIHKNWRNLYFLKERTGWIDEDYFDLASDLLKQRSIDNP